MGNAHYVLIGEASHGTHEFYRERAEITQRPDPREGGSHPGDAPSRPIGPTPHRVEPLRARERRCRRRGSARRLPALSAMDGATPTCSISSDGSGRTTIAAQPRNVSRLLRPRPLQPARVDDAVLDLSRHRRSRSGAARASATPASSSSVRTPSLTATAATTGLAMSCEGAVVEQLAELRRAASEYIRRDGRLPQGMRSSSPSQNARLVQNAGTLSPRERCSAAGTCSPGIFAIHTWSKPARRAHALPLERRGRLRPRWCRPGSQLSPRRCPSDPRLGAGVN